jgi:hypothetical protein
VRAADPGDRTLVAKKWMELPPLAAQDPGEGAGVEIERVGEVRGRANGPASRARRPR